MGRLPPKIIPQQIPPPEVRVNGLALSGASPQLRCRQDFVHQAVRCDGRALVALPEPLRSQKAPEKLGKTGEKQGKMEKKWRTNGEKMEKIKGKMGKTGNKWRKYGEKWGKQGKNGENTGKNGENRETMEKIQGKHGETSEEKLWKHMGDFGDILGHISTRKSPSGKCRV